MKWRTQPHEEVYDHHLQHQVRQLSKVGHVQMVRQRAPFHPPKVLVEAQADTHRDAKANGRVGLDIGLGYGARPAEERPSLGSDAGASSAVKSSIKIALLAISWRDDRVTP